MLPAASSVPHRCMCIPRALVHQPCTRFASDAHSDQVHQPCTRSASDESAAICTPSTSACGGSIL